MAEKINLSMSVADVIAVMGESNQGAMNILFSMMTDPNPEYALGVLALDSLEIRGSKLYMLNNDCCDRDMGKFLRTIKMLQAGVFTEEQVRTNLDRIRAIPFIDDDVEVSGIPPYDEDFGPGHPKWEEWCEAQKASFERRSAA